MASLREAREQLDDAGEEVVDAVDESIEAGKGEFYRLRDKLRDNGARLEEDLRDAGARLGEGARTLGSAIGEQVREHPLAAFGIAFVAGVIVSRAMRRR
jgi:ElaB/YqjD/DUF883 family membrane-anchored ribosome-binding protein